MGNENGERSSLGFAFFKKNKGKKKTDKADIGDGPGTYARGPNDFSRSNGTLQGSAQRSSQSNAQASAHAINQTSSIPIARSSNVAGTPSSSQASQLPVDVHSTLYTDSTSYIAPPMYEDEPPPYSASASESVPPPVPVLEKPPRLPDVSPTHLAPQRPITLRRPPTPPRLPTPPSQPLTLEQRLANIKKRVDDAKKGATVVTVDRDPSRYNIKVTIDGKNPEDVPDLQNLTDELKYDHPMFELMTAENVVQGPNAHKFDWSEIDPEIHHHYLGKISGTVSISAFAQEVRMAIKMAQRRLKITLWVSPDLPTFPSPELCEKIRRRNRVGLPATELEGYNDLVEIMGEGTFALHDPELERNFSNQSSVLINVLNNADYWTDLTSMSSISGPMSANAAKMNDFIYVLLLATELRHRIPHGIDRQLPTIQSKIKADMIISKRWEDHFDMKADMRFSINYSFRSLIHEQQMAGLIRFAEILDWPFLAGAKPKIEYAYRHLQNAYATNSHVFDWLFGLCLPGCYFSFKCMTVLVNFSDEISHIGQAPFYDSGLVLKDKSYWRITSPLGRVLGAASGARACLNWIGPCPTVIKGVNRLQPQWLNVAVKSVPTTGLTSFDENLDLSDDIVPIMTDESPPELIDEILGSFETSSNWVEPNPPPPLKYVRGRVKYGIVGIEVKRRVGIINEVDAPSEEIWYHASIHMKIDDGLIIYNLKHNPFFVCSHPCLGTHKTHKNRIPAVENNIVVAHELKRVASWSGILIINVRGSCNAEVAARAWCAEVGEHVLVKHQKTCFFCACQQARQMHLKVMIYR